MIAPLSSSYVDARSALLSSLPDGARHTEVAHPQQGLDDEALAIDIVEIGPADATTATLVVSGTHGVEGYLGSALQHHHLSQVGVNADHLTIFMHALNPFGFSWTRRVNEDNVDLNRNFIDWSAPPPANPAYGHVADLLVPASWSSDDQQTSTLELLAWVEQVGLEHAQQVISGGQWAHPTGVFYGGTGETWSHLNLTTWLTNRCASLERLAVIDLHTGLGEWGVGELISSEVGSTGALERQKAWWGDVTSMVAGDSVSADVEGDWVGTVPQMLPDVEVTGITIEYGTVDPITVLQSLRADATVHATGDPRSALGDQVRSQVRAAFLDDDPAWLARCWPVYERVFTVAAERLN